MSIRANPLDDKNTIKNTRNIPARKKILRKKRNQEKDVKQNYIEATLDFINKNSYEDLTKKTTHTYKDKTYKIGNLRENQRAKYSSLTSYTHKQEMIEEFNAIHPHYLLNLIEIENQIKINATIDFINKNTLEELTQKTTHIYQGKTFRIGNFRSNQKAKFKSLETQSQKQDMIEEFNIIHSDYLLDSFKTSKQNKINATIDFINKKSYEKLTSKTTHIYQGKIFNLGNFRNNQRIKYNSLKSESQKQAMIEEFSIIHPDYLSSSTRQPRDKYINATIDFINNNGYKNLKSNTTHTYQNKTYKIGVFRSTQRTKHKSLKCKSQKQAMIKELNIIHPDYLLDSLKT